MARQIRVSDSLVAEIGVVLETGERMLLIDREAGGLVSVRLDEVKALVAALAELAAGAAAESGDAELVFDEDLW